MQIGHALVLQGDGVGDCLVGQEAVGGTQLLSLKLQLIVTATFSVRLLICGRRDALSIDANATGLH